MKLALPALQVGPDDGFSKDTDIFQRKEFGDRLANLIQGSKENLVIALDSTWGEGKTTFTKMWIGHVEKHREHKIQCIYFDAFQNDYQKDPFLALISEIYELTADEDEKTRKEFLEKVGNAAKSIARGGLKIAIRTLADGLLADSIIDAQAEDLSQVISNQTDQLIFEKLKTSRQDKVALEEFKEYLTKFSNSRSKDSPIVFVIDELDRCRPDFALELIEQIKHLFSVEGFVFLLVMNRSQLEESIKSKYGYGIDATRYLQKFVNIWLSLPRRNEYSGPNDAESYVYHVINLMLEDGEHYINSGAMDMLRELVKYSSPSFREIERIASYFSLLHQMSVDRPFYRELQDIFCLVAHLNVTAPDLLRGIEGDSVAAEEIFVSLHIPIDPGEHSNHSVEHLRNLAEYDLGSEDLRKELIESGSVHLEARGFRNQQMIKRAAQWLTQISAA